SSVRLHPRLHLCGEDQRLHRVSALPRSSLCPNLSGLRPRSLAGAALSTQSVNERQTGRALHGASLESGETWTGWSVELPGVVPLRRSVFLHRVSALLEPDGERAARSDSMGGNRLSRCVRVPTHPERRPAGYVEWLDVRPADTSAYCPATRIPGRRG